MEEEIIYLSNWKIGISRSVATTKSNDKWFIFLHLEGKDFDAGNHKSQWNIRDALNFSSCSDVVEFVGLPKGNVETAFQNLTISVIENKLHIEIYDNHFDKTFYLIYECKDISEPKTIFELLHRFQNEIAIISHR